jgi:hypothetical protein
MFALLLFLFASAPVRAEVVASAPGGFSLQAEASVDASPGQAWASLLRIQNWWDSAHTYSGEAGRLRLAPRAGGCFCETWGRGQSVEHARVVMAMEREGVRSLRLIGGLGPLQEMGAAGVLTFTISPHAEGARISMTYRVSGDPANGFDRLAPLVDQVLMEQFARLTRYTASGSPS